MVRVASNCFVYEAQFEECEGLSEEVVGSRVQLRGVREGDRRGVR